MKVRASRVFVFATVAALVPATTLQVSAQSSPQANARFAQLSTTEASAEAKGAAAALAAKFSGDAPLSDTTPETAPQPQRARPDSASSAASQPVAPSIMAALSQSARPVGDHAADNATFAMQAMAGAEKPEARPLQARNKKIAKRKLAVGKRGGAIDDAEAQTQSRVIPPKKPADEPSVLAKIFNPSFWSWPGNDDPNDDKEPPDGAVRSALQPDDQ